MADLWQEIQEERVEQDREHGGPDNDDRLSESDWVALLCQFAGRAFSCARLGRADLYRSRMLQAAAIAVAALESYDRMAASSLPDAAVLRAGPDRLVQETPTSTNGCLTGT